MEYAVQVENLVKRYGTVNAVDNISFDVKQGEIFGILGPNGAGKTTTLEIIEGLLKPTGGSVTVLGMDLARNAKQVKSRIGVQLQSAAYFDYLSLREILGLLGTFYPRATPAKDLLQQVDLVEQAGMRLRQLSGGQKQRFTVAASLVNQPDLVILDEPTTGLDPQARRSLWSLVRQIHEQNITIVLTTHYMEEAQTLCQRLAIMDHGRLVAVDTPADLVGRLDVGYNVKVVLSRPLSPEQAAAFNGKVQLAQANTDSLGGTTYLFRLENTSTMLAGVLEQLEQTGSALEHLDITPVTLEDVFLTLTGNELREEH